MSEKGLYFVGATIASPQALNRIHAYEKKLKGEIKQGERHLTVLPPFWATYEEASGVNMGCTLASIQSSHPINTTLFGIQGLDIMSFGGVQFLHFPVQTFTQEEPWSAFVLKVRKRLRELKLEFRHPIPDEYRPHITVSEGKGLSDRSTRAIMRESKKEVPLYFNATYLTLYAKYKSGWHTLSSDPSRE
jgi:hypothetical protein